MLPCVCSVIDHRRRQNVVRTSVTHSAIASCATFLFLPHFDVICDLLLNRRTATWNLFVKYIICTDPATDIYQGACSRVSQAYIARRMLLPQDLLIRRRVSPCGFFRAQRLHSIILLFIVLFILSKAR